MPVRHRSSNVPASIDLMLRDLINALAKATMYPPGHRFIAESAANLVDRVLAALEHRDAITLGILPRGLLVDGVPVDPLPAVLRDFAARLHRKNIGTLYMTRGVSGNDIAAMLGALASPRADEEVGRDGLRLDHLRVEPLTYDVLTFADPMLDSELDDVFWMALVETAFGRRLAEGDAIPTPQQIADAISERAAQSSEGARRVYEALAGFSSALTSRPDRGGGGARRRFVDVLSALSRPTTTRVVQAAPSTASRRRFLRETLELVPAGLLMQLLESVAEADGEPISPHLRWLLGKLAGGEGPGDGTVSGAFANEVLGLVQQWDGVSDDAEDEDPRIAVEPGRLLAAGLELKSAAPAVIDAARRMAQQGQLLEVLQLIDHEQNDRATARAIGDAVLDPELINRLLAAPTIDFGLVERVARHAGPSATVELLNALGAAEDRSTRRRLLDILVRVGSTSQATLLSRLESAPWYLARNILAVLGQLPTLEDPAPVFAALAGDEPRVRQEALRVLVRHDATRDRAVAEALESGEPTLARIALAALSGGCPPRLVAAVLTSLGSGVPDVQLQALRALHGTGNPLVVPHLLALVRSRRGLLRRQRLLPKTPVMLAALELLAARWSAHRPVITIMQLAAASHDADVRAAIGQVR